MMNVEALIQFVERVGTPRALLIGDLILDRYLWGEVDRISPEAPIPVVRALREEARVGGAGNAAADLRALGADVVAWGVVGDDADGRLVLDSLRAAGVDAAGVLRDGSRRTTVKTRVMGLAQRVHPQQLLRIDWEDTGAIDRLLADRAIATITAEVPRCQAVVVSDYGKGTLPTAVLAATFEAARQAGVPTVVDPARGRPLEDYRGASILKPNRYEAAAAVGLPLPDEAALRRAGTQMLRLLDLDAAVITLEREGMFVVRREGEPMLVPTRPRAVYDVTGAGDMVTATLAWALAGGASLDLAVDLANVTGGMEVERLGVVPIARAEVLNELRRQQYAAADKVKSLPELLEDLARRRRAGQRIVWTNGCFDIIHSGHMEYLAFAKRQGDVLVVGLNSDASVRRLKGPARPINSVHERTRVLAGLSAVDYVVVFDDDTPIEQIRQVRPHVLVKGEDWRDKGVVGQEFVESCGGQVVLAPLVKGVSTTATIERAIQAIANGRQTVPQAEDGLVKE
jgi:D-beta-D-heptose 7-phosphate kinase/D-beta-D-heptose 1-phosphate adenosyltransferase